MSTAAESTESEQHISSFGAMFLIGSLRLEGGEALVERVLTEAGETRHPDELCDPMQRSSYGQVRRLFEATTRVTGNRARLHDAGLYALRELSGSTYLEMFQAIGSTAALVARTDELTTLMSSINTCQTVEIGPNAWEISLALVPGFEPFREWCWFNHGLLSISPMHYGFPLAQVIEQTCQCEGAPACRFRVTWSEGNRAGSDDRAEQFEYLSWLLSARLGELQRTVTELVSNDEIETILTRIVSSARNAVAAPSYLLALGAVQAATQRVYAEGLDPIEADYLAQRLLASNTDEPGAGEPGLLVSPIRSAHQSYGYLAAIDANGTRDFMAEERAVLDTYGSMAAAALDVSCALDDARQQTQLAETVSRQLADERTLLSAIVDGLPHGVCWADGSGLIQGANQALAELLGHLGVDEILGCSWAEVAPDPAVAEEVVAVVDQVTDGGTAVINAQLAIGPADARRVLLLSVAPLPSEAGDNGALSIWADITTQQALEQRLTETSRLESVGQLAAGVAHEINTPMQYIGNNGAFLAKAFGLLSSLIADLLVVSRDQGADPSVIDGLTAKAKLDTLQVRIPETTNQISEGVEAVSRIVRSLKTFAHPGGDDYEPVDLAALIDSTVTVSSSEWRYVATLDVTLPDHLPPVRAVPGMINQVVLNLIVNAAHAIEGGTHHGNGKPGKITIAGATVDSQVELAITDNGTGIPPEIQDRIYDQFFTTKQLGKGTGLGLAICRNIVTRHGGTIDFTTSPEGTTFTIRLPMWEPPATPPAAETEGVSVGLRVDQRG